MKKAKFRGIAPKPLVTELVDPCIYLKASIESIYEETLIISAYAVVNKRKAEGYICVFQQFITENDFVAINYFDSKDGIWSESTLLRFFESKRWHFVLGDKYYNYLKCETESDNEIINKYYQTTHSVGINLINHHQLELRKSAVYYKHDIERRELERIHIQAIYLPSDLHAWISTEIAKDNAKYFYVTDKKTKLKRGTCSYCKSESIVKTAKHNEYGICPSCNTKVQFKGLNRAKYYTDYDHFAFAQRIDTGLMIRRFKVKLDYKHPDKKSSIKETDIALSELSRSILEESKQRSAHYDYGEFIKGEYRWKQEEQSYNYFGNSNVGYSTRNTFMRLYPNNLKEVISNTKWEYCALEMFKGKIDPIDYLEFEESKLLEMIVRRGFNKLAQDMINARYNTKFSTTKIEFTKMMGLSEYAYFMAKKHDLGLIELEIVKSLESSYGIKPSYEQIMWIESEHIKSTEVYNIMKYSSLQKAINYIEKKSKEEKLDLGDVIIEWNDYITAAIKLKYNLKDDILLYPRNLAQAHDVAMLNVNSNRDKAFNRGIKKTYEKFKWLNFNTNDLEIKVAKNVKEIHKESQVLGHCVARMNYMEMMSKEKTLILTLRKKETPDIPYFTVEINPETFVLRQYESKNRLRKSDEVEKFLKAWKKHIEKSLAKGLNEEPKKIERRNIDEYRIAN